MRFGLSSVRLSPRIGFRFVKIGPVTIPVPTISLQFNQASNSQYLALVSVGGL